MNRIYYLALITLLAFNFASAQILQVSPLFPTRNEQITVTYDASQGNTALAGVTPPIYCHTGLITSSSTSMTDWKYTQGNWGTADNHVLMTSLGNNKYTISFNVNSFYGDATSDTILYLAFVFRNTNGSIVGRNADGSDILLRIYTDSFQVGFINPTGNNLLMALNSSLNIHAAANRNAALQLTVNGNILGMANGDSLYYNNYHLLNYGAYNFVISGTAGTKTAQSTLNVFINPPLLTQSPPAGTVEGINYPDDSTVILELVAPNKNYIYVIGDFNNWQADTNYYMHRASDNQTWWLKISHLVPGKEYIFQYLVDGSIKVGDPYSTKISDPYDDNVIPNSTYPNLIHYPTGSTTGIASVLQTGQHPYQWQYTNFQRPAKKALTIYELLVRDFVTTQSWPQVIDSLDYLKKLGINAIELMPIMNFESTSSWGYNTNYFCAPEKIYGPADSFKRFVDVCHGKGIAVLLDIPFNDAFGTNPMVMMYWDSINQQPAANNPWFNTVATHPYSVGYDFNHESQYTRNFVKNVTRFWLREFHTDGYRFDLTKGYTQFNSGNNVGLWAQYDQSRVNNLERMVDSIWAVDPTAYCVFEELADNSEETELSNHGIMLWGNMNTQYNQTTMGYNTGWDLTWAGYKARGWSNPNLVTYMESHDEERLMYNNKKYGDSITGYDIKAVDTGLRRMELAGDLFFTIPGPKMIWQFGELGYDVSINNGCRICNKPILWIYEQKPNREHLYRIWSALINLRSTYSTFQTSNYTTNLSGAVKSIQLTDPGFDAVAVGNCDVVTNSASPGFQHTGWWYDYFSGDSINVTSTGQTITFLHGEYHLYTDKKLQTPNLTTDVEEITAKANSNINLYPNPNTGEFNLTFDMAESASIRLNIYDLSGKSVFATEQDLAPGIQNIHANINGADLAHTSSGIYFYRLVVGEKVYNGKISIITK